MRHTFKIGKNVPQIVSNWTAFANASEGLLEATVYPGAGLIADEIRKAIEALPVIDMTVKEDGSAKVGGKQHARKDTSKGKTRKGAPAGVTKVEKEGLLEWASGTGMGLAPMRTDKNFLNTKVGFNGYNKHITPNYPKGHPNAMIARSVESGTSFRRKTPFIAPTVRAFRNEAESLMAKEFDKLVSEFGNKYKSSV